MADNPQALLAISLGLILFSLIVIALFIIFVHTMPGKIARKRGNPQAEAIEILSLLGLLIEPSGTDQVSSSNTRLSRANGVWSSFFLSRISLDTGFIHLQTRPCP